MSLFNRVPLGTIGWAYKWARDFGRSPFHALFIIICYLLTLVSSLRSLVEKVNVEKSCLRYPDFMPVSWQEFWQLSDTFLFTVIALTLPVFWVVYNIGKHANNIKN